MAGESKTWFVFSPMDWIFFERIFLYNFVCTKLQKILFLENMTTIFLRRLFQMSWTPSVQIQIQYRLKPLNEYNRSIRNKLCSKGIDCFSILSCKLPGGVGSFGGGGVGGWIGVGGFGCLSLYAISIPGISSKFYSN